MEDETLFKQVGGRETLERVHKVFYDKLYDHVWFKQIFDGIDQKVIENQQTDFMTSNMGGGKIYSGGLPKPAHRHIYITDEMFELRKKILHESLTECGVPDELAERWLKIDQAFKKSVIKSDPNECEKRYFTDELIIIPKPDGL